LGKLLSRYLVGGVYFWVPTSGRRGVINTLITAALISILYRYWLVTPVLKYLSIGQWRLIAVVVAAVSGCVLFQFRFSVLALACGSMAGLLIGGTWAEWRAPNDVTITVSAAFASHLESFWREVIVLTVTVIVGGFCVAALERRGK
jgi:hypothetical protein